MILHQYLGLTKIQIEVKERKFQFIWKESIYHEILDFELDLLIHVFVAILIIKASLPCVVFVTVGILDDIWLQIKFDSYEKWRKI